MSDPIFLVGEAPFKSPREIVKGTLYQGGAMEGMSICYNPKLLASLGLKAIVTVAHDVRIRVPSNIVHLHLPVDESNPTPPYYFELASNLNLFPLFVHCMAGVNRSRVFAAAIAWKTHKMSLEAAIDLADPPRCGIVFESLFAWAKTQSLE